MDKERLTDALDSLTRHDLEVLQKGIKARLLACLLCGTDGATIYRVAGQKHAGLALCAKCFEKHRLPENWVGKRGVRVHKSEEEDSTS